MRLGDLMQNPTYLRGVYPYAVEGRNELTAEQVKELEADAKFQLDPHGPEISTEYREGYRKLLDSLRDTERQFTLSITAFGKTRDVRFHRIREDSAYSEYIFLGRFPKGNITWRVNMSAFRHKQPDGTLGPWTPSFRYYALNRSHAQIFAWAEDYPDVAAKARVAP